MRKSKIVLRKMRPASYKLFLQSSGVKIYVHTYSLYFLVLFSFDFFGVASVCKLSVVVHCLLIDGYVKE